MEQDECGRGSASQRQDLVVQNAAEGGEAAVLVHRGLGLLDHTGWQSESGHGAVVHAPAQEELGGSAVA
nr:hypothetical protein [Streptomyces sp. TLI_235]